MGKIAVCEVCGSPKCSGQILKASYRAREGDIVEYKVCRSQVKEKNGRFTYRVIIGHGEWEDCEAVPVEND